MAEETTNKRMFWPIVLVGCLLAIIVSGTFAVWHFVLQPAGKDVVQQWDALKQIERDLQKDNVMPPDQLRTTLQRGQPRADVDALLGVGVPATDATIERIAAAHPNGKEPFRTTWLARTKSGRAWQHDHATGLYLTADDAQQTLQGCVGWANGVVTEYLPLPRMPHSEPQPVATLATRELERSSAMYVGQWIVVKGAYGRAVPGPAGAFEFCTTTQTIVVRPPTTSQFDWSDPPDVLELIAVVAQVQVGRSDRFITLVNARVVERAPAKGLSVSAAELSTAFAKDVEAAQDVFGDRVVRVSGVVVGNDETATGQRLRLHDRDNTDPKATVIIACHFDAEQRANAINYPLNKTITILGYCRGSTKTMGVRAVELTNCRIVK